MKARAIVFGAGLVLVATPAWALCPSCLGQSSTLGAALRLVGIFLLVPPAIFFTVALAIRKVSGQGPSAPASGGGGDQGG
jgi:hypothetical protein